MSTAETLYTFATPYPDILQAGRAAVVKMPVYRDNALVAPTASGSSFTLINSAGTTVVSAAAVTVSGSVAQYTISAGSIPTTAALGEGWLERWVLVLPDSTTRTVERRAALALYDLHPVITDSDVLAMYPDLMTWVGSSVTTLQGWIDEGWKRIISRLYRVRRWPYLIKSADSFRTAHIELVAMLWAQYAAKGRPGSNFMDLAAQHQRNFESEWAQMAVAWDADHDGLVDDPEATTAVEPTYRLSGRRSARNSA